MATWVAISRSRTPSQVRALELIAAPRRYPTPSPEMSKVTDRVTRCVSRSTVNGTRRAVNPALAVRKTPLASRIPRSTLLRPTYRRPCLSWLNPLPGLGFWSDVAADRGDDCCGQQIAGDVDSKDELDAWTGEQESAEGWCGQADHAARDGGEGVGGGEFLTCADDCRSEGAGGGAEDGGGQILCQDGEVDEPDAFRGIGEQDQGDGRRASRDPPPTSRGRGSSDPAGYAGPRPDDQSRGVLPARA